MPWLQAAGARAKLLLSAMAEGAGSPSDDNADTAVDEAFAALDVDPKDGKLNTDELGLHAALALVNPSLASHGDALLSMAMGKDGLDKANFVIMLECLTQILGEYVSDVNGDGDANAGDVKVMAQMTA